METCANIMIGAIRFRRGSERLRLLRLLVITLTCVFTLVGCVDQSLSSQNYLNESLIQAAHEGNEMEVVRLLNKGASVNARDEAEGTALFYAAGNDHLSVVRILLNRGASVNAQDHNGDTALDVTSDNKIRTLLKERGGKRGDKGKATP